MDREKSLIAERAAEWLQQLEQAGPEERARFVKWLKESPQHGWEILLATSTDIALKQLIRRAGFTATDVDCQRSNVSPMHAQTSRGSTADPRGLRAWCEFLTGSYRNARRLAAVIAFLIVVSLTAVAIQAVSERTIATGPDEWRTARLTDGTIIRIRPQTRVTVDITDHERVLRLAHGGVMAYVARDATRPFSVETDLAVARAIGTAFAVQHTGSAQVSITVKEGVVGVTRASRDARRTANSAGDEPIFLRAGQQVRVKPDGSPLDVRTVDVANELSWAQERLIFRTGMTMADAIREFNVRNRTQIRLLDHAIGQRLVVGVFDATDPISFVTTLEKSLPLSIVDDQSGTLLLVPKLAEDAGVSQEPVAP